MSRDIAIRHSFSRAAATYDAHATLQYAVAEKTAKLLSPYLHAGMMLLDAGCGTGAMARYLPNESTIMQLDSAFGMARSASAIHPACCADMRALPFADASFDVYVSSLSLQWIEELHLVFSECRRVLRPGGSALFSTLGPGTLRELREAFRVASLEEHVHRFASYRALDEALEASGLRLMLFKQELRTLSFESPLTLLRHLKGIGATYRAAGGGLHGRHYLRQLEESLRTQEQAEVPASFEVFYLLAEAQ